MTTLPELPPPPPAAAARLQLATKVGRHRPSGEPPPLPRHVDRTSRAYVALGTLSILLSASLTDRRVMSLVTHVDDRILRLLAGVRVEHVTAVMRDVNAV